MHLVQILLPLYDKEGQPYERDVFLDLREELTTRFGGLTAYSRAPAEGLWKPAAKPADKDDIIVYEVMARRLEEAWWSEFRRRLEARLSQEQIVIRASAILLL